MAALKRLLREAFAELTEHGGRLHALETASTFAAGGGWATGADLDPSAAAEITFMGAVEAAPALLLSRVRLHQTYSLSHPATALSGCSCAIVVCCALGGPVKGGNGIRGPQRQLAAYRLVIGQQSLLQLNGGNGSDSTSKDDV